MQVCLGPQGFQKGMSKLPPKRAEFYTKSSGIRRGFVAVTPGPHLQAEPPGQKEPRAAAGKGEAGPGWLID